MKRCTKCGEMKAPDAFSKDARAKDGLFARCKACAAAHTAAYYAANAEKVRFNAAAYRAANPDKVRASAGAWRAANPDKVRAYKGAYSVAYRAANPDKVRVIQAVYRAANPEIVRAQAARRRARKRAVECDPCATLPAVIARDGADCYICGIETDPAAPPRARHKAELEHVIPLAKGGTHTMGNLRCACYPCNAVKGAHFTAEQVREMFA